jgi:large subunit ribosomal protein L13
MATQSAKASEIERKWYVVDAAGQPLGRLASKVAHVLRGKHRPEFTPHVDTGDFVIITNAAQIRLTGNKLDGKFYHRHSGYPGGLRSESYGHLLGRKPEFVIERAVKGMLPKNSLGRQMFRKLKVYSEGTHPHVAQKPEPFPL